jgi:hypothetical protein
MKTESSIVDGVVIQAFWLRRWIAAGLQIFDATFFSAQQQGVPVSVPVQPPMQSWVIALESANRCWSAWHI